MREVMTRLAYDAFMLVVEKELCHLRNEDQISDTNEFILEETESFYAGLQSTLNTHRKISINYNAVWDEVFKLIQSHIDLALYTSDSEAEERYRNYLGKYYYCDCEFVAERDLLDDTLVAEITVNS